MKEEQIGIKIYKASFVVKGYLFPPVGKLFTIHFILNILEIEDL